MTVVKNICNGLVAAIPNALVLYPTALVLGSLAGTGMWPSLFATFIGTTLLSIVNQHANLVHAPATSMCIAGAAVSAQYGLSTACVAGAMTGVMQFLLGKFGRTWIFYVIPKHVTNVIISAVGVSLIIHQMQAFHTANFKANTHSFDSAYVFNGIFLIVGLTLIASLQNIKSLKNYAFVLVPTFLAVIAYSFDIQVVPWGDNAPVDTHLFANQFIEWDAVNWLGALTSAFTLLFICSMKEAVVISRLEELSPSAHRPDINKQFRWLGLANLTCGLCAFPPLAVITDRSIQSLRNAPNNRLSVFFQGLLVLGFGFFAPDVFKHVPVACIAMLLMYSGFKLIDWSEVHNIRKMSRAEAGLVMTVFATVLTFDIPAGTVVAVVIALVHLGFSFASDCEILINKNDEGYVLKIKGAMTFLSIPRLKELTDHLNKHTKWELDIKELFFIDYASRCYIEEMLSDVLAKGGFANGEPLPQILSLTRLSRIREQVLDEVRALDRRASDRSENFGRRAMDRYLAEQKAAVAPHEKTPKDEVISSEKEQKSEIVSIKTEQNPPKAS